MSEEVFIPDTNFFIDLIEYYDAYGENPKLLDFLKRQIESQKIHILDRVFDELKKPKNNRLKEDLNLGKSKINTDFLLEGDCFDKLAEKYYIKKNEKFLKSNSKDSKELIEKQKRDYKDECADLYLILYSKRLKKQGFEPYIITNESEIQDRKLYEKIPTICKGEEIKVMKNSDFIFKYFYLAEKTTSSKQREGKHHIFKNI